MRLYNSNSISERIKIFARYRDVGDINWDKISVRMSLTEEFMSEFKSFLNWQILSRHQRMSLKFICEHHEYVHWAYIISRYTLPDYMINEYQHLFDTEALSLLKEIQNDSSN